MAIATGLDIGHHTVRAVVLERKGRALRVLAAAAVPRSDALGEPKPISTVVAELDAMVRFRGEIVVADSGLSVLVRFISTMPLPPDRLARLLRLELSQHADSSGDLAADTVVVPIPGDEILHCCVLAQPPQVYSTLVDLREAKVRQARLHFTPIAAYNATQVLPPVQDDALALLVDVGSHTTGLTLFGDDRLLACRQISSGGDAFTEALVANGMERTAAEQAKRRSGANGTVAAGGDAFDQMLEQGLDAAAPATPPAPPARGDTDGQEVVLLDDEHPLDGPEMFAAPSTAAAPAPAPAAPAPPPSGGSGTAAVTLDPALVKAADTLFGHIVSSLTWFKTQLKLRTIDPKLILLTGGAAATPGLAEYLARRLHYPVERFDPFAGIDEGTKPEQPHEWAAAVGCALAAPSMAQRGAVRLDLRPEAMIRRELWMTRLIWPYVAAALLVMATVFAILALHRSYADLQTNLAHYTQDESDYQAAKTRLDALDHDKEALSRDLRMIATRIYAGRDVLNAITALKLRTEESKELWVTELTTLDIGQDAQLRKKLEALGMDVSSVVAPSDATIDRGAIQLSGKVQFGASALYQERLQFVADWETFLQSYQPPGQPRLFSYARQMAAPDKEDAHSTHGGQSSFTVLCMFAPTDLASITTSTTARKPH